MDDYLQRRRFLKGIGASVTLPALESLVAPASALAAASESAAARALTASGAPLRMGFVYFPNGVNYERWRPSGEGDGYEFNQTMEPLAGLRDRFQVFSGFEHNNGWSHEDGAGDHARATSTFLTGARPRKTAGADIQLGVSVDQIAAQQIGDLTRFSSLELSCDGVRKAGQCDSGYSCAYQFNISWRSDSTPMTPEANPRLVFERLFGAGPASERKRNYELRQRGRQSILDFVLEDARQLRRRLGAKDQQKVDEYLTGVREIESRIEKAERFDVPNPGVDAPGDGIPASYEEHIRLMFDLMALAYQTDSTRVSTLMLAHDGSNRSFAEIGIPEGHHTLSHHQDKSEKLNKLAQIDRFYVKQFAYFLEKLAQTEDVDGKSVLDNSMIVYGSGLCDPNRHQHDNLPVILAGRGGGALHPGRHVRFSRDLPMTNLYLTMLAKMGIKADRVGDSTGTLDTI